MIRPKSANSLAFARALALALTFILYPCKRESPAPQSHSHPRKAGHPQNRDRPRMSQKVPRADTIGKKFGAAIVRACCRNLFGTHPTVVRGVEGPAGQATVACLPQSRARQEAAGKPGECFDADETVSCSWLTAVDMCIGWTTRLLHVPPLPVGRGSVGAGWDLMHGSCDLGNTPVRSQK